MTVLLSLSIKNLAWGAKIEGPSLSLFEVTLGIVDLSQEGTISIQLGSDLLLVRLRLFEVCREEGCRDRSSESELLGVRRLRKFRSARVVAVDSSSSSEEGSLQCVVTVKGGGDGAPFTACEWTIGEFEEIDRGGRLDMAGGMTRDAPMSARRDGGRLPVTLEMIRRVEARISSSSESDSRLSDGDSSRIW